MRRMSFSVAVIVSIAFASFEVFLAASDWRPLGEMGMRLPRSRIAVSVEGRHSCAVLGDGSVRCWGANDAGQLGNGVTTTGATSTPVTVSGITTAIAVSTGRTHSCVLLVAGTVQCWGANAVGQLGNGTTTPSSSPVTVSTLTNVVSLSAGSRHTCARTAAGTVRCWGSNSEGQLGDGTRTTRTAPVDADPLLDARSVAAGTDHTCAVRATGVVVCWGGNGNGQLGVGDINRRTRPTAVDGVSNVKHVSAGRSVTCATVAGGDVFCWGRNAVGQLGNGTTNNSLTPTLGGESFFGKFSTSVGGEHVCALTVALLSAGGSPENSGPVIECWGQNSVGQLGNGSVGAAATNPVRVSAFGALMEYAAGSTHSCALMDDERVRCWGRNDAGQLGTGSTTDSPVPALTLGLAGSVTARGLAAGLNHSCAWRADGNGACWGRNASGQLGDGTFLDRLAPVAVPTNGRRLMSMAGGDHHTCFGAVTGGISCWGQNLADQVAPLDSVPDFVTSPTSFVSMSISNLVAGTAHTLTGRPARFNDDIGGTNGWGANSMRQLGDVFESISGLFVSAGPLEPPMGVVTGLEHSCALLADGSVWCWGANRFGQLGMGSLAPGPFAAPQQVLGVADATSIAAGAFHTCVVRVNGTVQCWGRNDFRQIGDGTLIDRVFATDVPGIAAGGAVALALGRTHSCVLTPSGGVRCWGRNDRGQLGDTSFTDRAGPVFVQQPVVFFNGQPLLSQTATLNQVVGIVSGQTHTCARRVTGRPFCWGNNEDGQIGDGTNTNRPVAMGVPSFTANMVPTAAMSDSGRHIEVSAVLSCEAGARFDVQIEVMQGDVEGQGQAHGHCTGALEPIAVKVNAVGPQPFDAGAATAVAVFEVKRGSRVLDTQRWTRTLTLAVN